jgi:hypothetical protein
MKNQTKFILLFCVFFFGGCSNLSKNTVESGKFAIRNGVMGTKSWNEDLVFDRYSWYHELTLQFELLIAKMPPQSGFNFWLSKDELEQVNKCRDTRIVMAYSLDTKIIPYSQLYEQLERNGFAKFELIEFKRNLIAHPDSVMNSLKLYHVFGVCRKGNEFSQVKISFPGFTEKLLN